MPTTDWQDAFPHKYGRTISTQALYYQVLKLTKNQKSLRRLKRVVNEKKGNRLWHKNFYLAYRWKNHNKYVEEGEWFDTLGNLWAIIYGLADKKRSAKILSYIEKNNINKPYPVKSIYPAIKKNSKYWKDYFEDCDARNPYNYLNGGIWPFIGGFYVLALIKMKKIAKAKKELEKLAESNLKGDFPEWIDPKTKETYGNMQAWDAGLYMLAYKSVKKKRVLL